VKAKQKMSESNDGNINLDAMSLDQLDQLKQQEEGRLQVLTTRYSQLRAAAARLNAAQMAVSELSPALEGKEVMVALTGTLYVPGKILEPNKLLVDLGTGFYVEKTPKDTKAFLERKTKLVVQVTRQNIEQVTMAMRGKLLEIRARQEGRMQRTIDAQKS
jgi:prefoldin alpha subunit